MYEWGYSCRLVNSHLFDWFKNKVGPYNCNKQRVKYISQGVLEDYVGLVFACRSGGTAAGLSKANYLTGSKIR